MEAMENHFSVQQLDSKQLEQNKIKTFLPGLLQRIFQSYFIWKILCPPSFDDGLIFSYELNLIAWILNVVRSIFSAAYEWGFG